MVNFSNIIAGAASVQLFPPRTDYQQVRAQVEKMSVADRMEFDTAFKKHIRERMLGQLIMAALSLSLMLLALVGAVNKWSDFVVGLCATAPWVLMFVVAKLHRKNLIS